MLLNSGRKKGTRDACQVSSLHPSNDYKTVRMYAHAKSMPWQYSIALLLWLLVCVVRLESSDDTGNLQSRYLFLAVPDPSGEVSDLFFGSRLKARKCRSCQLRPAISLGSSFQHAVVRSINDKNAQLQKQLENLVREGSYCLPVKELNFRPVTLRSSQRTARSTC